MALAAGLAGLALLGLVASWVLVPLSRRWALRVGLVDRPGLPRKGQAEPIPYGGGLAVFIVVFGLGIALWCLAAAAAAWDWTPAWLDETGGVPTFFRDGWAYFLDLARGARGGDALRKGSALLAGGAMVFVIGMYDDWQPVRPRIKLLVQGVAAVLPLLAGYCVTFPLEFLQGDWRWLGMLVSWATTWLWIVLVTNAFNLLDNMDGLSGGVTVWSSLLFGVVAWQHGQAMVAAVLALLFGAMLGFLRYNWPPAKVYLGDAGALFAGYLLGVMTIGTHFYAGKGGIYAVATPVCVLAVPLYDSLSVLYIRWRNGKPLFEGDHNHLSHRLVRLGLDRRSAVMAICLLTAITGAAATLLAELGPAGAFTVFGLTLAILLLVWMLETAARRLDNDKP